MVETQIEHGIYQAQKLNSGPPAVEPSTVLASRFRPVVCFSLHWLSAASTTSLPREFYCTPSAAPVSPQFNRLIKGEAPLCVLV